MQPRGHTLACAQTLADLAVSAETTYTCETGALTTGFTNTATVNASSTGGAVQASASETVTVVPASITITKVPDVSRAVEDSWACSAGCPVEWAATYTCTTCVLTADLTNMAVVTADGWVSANATAVVEVVAPALTITKTPPARESSTDTLSALGDSPV